MMTTNDCNIGIEAVDLRLFVPFFINNGNNDVEEPMQFFRDSITSLTHNEMLTNFPAPSSLNNEIVARDGNMYVWEPINANVNNVFYPHFGRLLGGCMGDLLQSYKLNEGISYMLARNHDEEGEGLLWIPSDGKMKEDFKPIPIGFCDNKKENKEGGVEGLKLHLFGVGCGLLEIPLTIFGACNFEMVKRFVYDFTHAVPAYNYQYRIFWAEDESKSFALKNIVDGLLGQNEGQTNFKFEGLDVLRYFSYVTVRCKNVIDTTTLGEMAFSLAHRQTEGYHPIVENFENSVYQPFANISHASSMEGGATTLCASDTASGNEHVNGFIGDKLKNNYLPMFVLSYFEFIYLVNLIGRISPNINVAHKDEETIKQLESITEQILKYRLYYRFTKVSRLSQHNSFYERWRQTFDSDRVMQNLMDDIQQINSYLNYVLGQKNQEIEKRQNKLMGVLGVGATGMLSLIGLFGTNLDIYADGFKLLSRTTGLSMLVVGVFTSVAMVVYWYFATERK